MCRQRNLFILLCAAFFIPGCATVEITGRTQLNLISDSELLSAANQAYLQLINAAHSKGAVLLPTESKEAEGIIALVNRVSNDVIDASGLRYKYNWEVTVLKSDIPNAFVLPNGKIVVFTGLLPLAANEAGLAAIIGHEVAHVAARHAAERVSQALLTNATLSAVDASLAARNQRNRPVISAALGLGAHLGIRLPFSREHESEADRIGQVYMAKAGYDPAEAIAFWERAAARSGQSKFEFMSTHPNSETRTAQLREWLPQAQIYYADRQRPLPTSLASLDAAQKDTSKSTGNPSALTGATKEVIPIDATTSYSANPWARMNRKVEQEPPPPAPVGKFTVEVERIAKAEQCHASPTPALSASGPGFENYTIPCANGDALSVRCEFGNCRTLK